MYTLQSHFRSSHTLLLRFQRSKVYKRLLWVFVSRIFHLETFSTILISRTVCFSGTSGSFYIYMIERGSVVNEPLLNRKNYLCAQVFSCDSVSVLEKFDGNKRFYFRFVSASKENVPKKKSFFFYLNRTCRIFKMILFF